MERTVNFARDRFMMCGQCGYRWKVSLDWIDRWDQGREVCPGCRIDCTDEAAPRVTVDTDDPALVDENVARFAWYHTSTHADWPPRRLDPAAGLTRQTRLMMGGDDRVAEWAARQRAKALHVGTYEAAIHNMLRRLDDQGDDGKQFYMYRVRLRSDIVVGAGWLIDPSDFVGDVNLAEVCPPGVDVARYLNYHEDPGGLSLALGRGAIASTQQLAMPPLTNLDEDWISSTAYDIRTATETPPRPAWMRAARMWVAPQAHRAGQIGADLARRLPVNLRDQFRSAVAYTQESEPDQWARHALGLATMVETPEQLIADIARQTDVRV